MAARPDAPPHRVSSRLNGVVPTRLGAGRAMADGKELEAQAAGLHDDIGSLA
jgi:hypothetical protein